MTKGLNLDKIGVELDKRGRVVIGMWISTPRKAAVHAGSPFVWLRTMEWGCIVA